MAKRGDVLDNGNMQLRFLQTTRDTDGALVEVEATYQPRSPAPPRHIHPAQEERFELTAGSLVFELDGVQQTYHRGDEVIVPARAVHRAWNPLDEPARVIWQTRPALETEAFFEVLYGLARLGKTDPRGRPSLLHISLMARRFASSWELVSPPRVVRSCVFGALTPFAHLLGAGRDVQSCLAHDHD